MNEWNIRQKDLQDAEEAPRGRQRRVAFCPTCGRPFLRGTGARDSAQAGRDTSAAGRPPDPRDREYCSGECLPGKLC